MTFSNAAKHSDRFVRYPTWRRHIRRNTGSVHANVKTLPTGREGSSHVKWPDCREGCTWRGSDHQQRFELAKPGLKRGQGVPLSLSALSNIRVRFFSRSRRSSSSPDAKPVSQATSSCRRAILRCSRWLRLLVKATSLFDMRKADMWFDEGVRVASWSCSWRTNAGCLHEVVGGRDAPGRGSGKPAGGAC